MSRTTKKKPAVGKEYWSARPGNKHGSTPSAYGKRKTHRMERQQAKNLCRGD